MECSLPREHTCVRLEIRGVKPLSLSHTSLLEQRGLQRSQAAAQSSPAGPVEHTGPYSMLEQYHNLLLLQH
jgi:hypothetical protein